MFASRQPRITLWITAVLALVIVLVWPGGAQAAVEQPTVAAAATVRVGADDTLWGIAARRCGTPVAWPALWAANRSRIANPDLIYPGQVLAVSCRAVAAASRSTSRTAPLAGWLHPLRAGLRAAGPGACWGAARVGHTHKGVDLLARSGTPVRAVHAGRVVRISYQAGGAGWYVMIDHGGGIFTVSMHLRSRPPLAVGAHVAAGARVGYVGQTGNAATPHLHFEVHRGAWHPVDPAPFMRAHGVQLGCG